MTITVPAYAKINLFLDIHSMRENGYHNIISLMQSVSLHDDVTVSFTPSDNKTISVFSNNSSIPCDKSNLAYKAADIFPAIGEIKIQIVKNIPISAGLAGGSTDAAATLTALNSMTGNPLSIDQLCMLGAKLGADVPFCIKKTACLAEGIGEILTSVNSMPRYPLVIAKKGAGMSTPEAYKALDNKFNRFSDYTPNFEKLNILINKIHTLKELCSGLYNIFETVVEPERPFVTEIKEIMLANRAAGAMMSGSGTSAFGIFESEIDAIAAQKALLEYGAEAHVCYPE